MEEQADWRRDGPQIALLLALYILQGIPMGLAGSIPLLLQEQGVGHDGQAMFALVSWPYSIKLLWAPIVDGFYSTTFGRRKSWVVPVQFGVAAGLIAISFFVEDLLTRPTALTGAFFFLYLLVATQDVAVDGWALTLLSRANVGYAATCNSVGQLIGYFGAYLLFFVLNNPDICNAYFRATPAADGLVSLPAFLFASGVAFAAVTTLVLFTPEHGGRAPADAAGDGDDDDKDEDGPQETVERFGVAAAYLEMWDIVRRPAVLRLALVLVTAKIAFAPEFLLQIRLVDMGMPKESVAGLAMALVPLEIALPLLLSRFTAGKRPFDLFTHAWPVRLALSGVLVLTVLLLPPLSREALSYSTLAILTALYALLRSVATLMFSGQLGFFSTITDPRVGGTMMTMLNTMANLGGQLPAPLYLRLLGATTTKHCVQPGQPRIPTAGAYPLCDTPTARTDCVSHGGHCLLQSDSFPVIACLALAAGATWFVFLGPVMHKLQSLPLSAWRGESTTDAAEESAESTDAARAPRN